MCNCIKITYEETENPGVVLSIDVPFAGTFNGNNYFFWQSPNTGQPYYLYYSPTQPGWEVSNVLGGIGAGGIFYTAIKNSPPGCPPFASLPQWTPNSQFATFTTEPCSAPKCLNFTYQINPESPQQTVNVSINLIDGNGRPVYIFQLPEYPGVIFQICYLIGGPYGDNWYIVTNGPGGDWFTVLDGITLQYPYDTGAWLQNSYFSYIYTEGTDVCPVDYNLCDCGIKFEIYRFGNLLETVEIFTNGLYNERPRYEFEIQYFGITVSLFWNGTEWVLVDVMTDEVMGVLHFDSMAPTGNPYSWINYQGWQSFLPQKGVEITTTCIECDTCGQEDRFFRKYEAIKLPENFQDPNRGLKDCCCEIMVLASSSSNSWENDLTSAWIKLNDGGTATFKLLKEGNETNYTPQPNNFLNEPNAIYTTVNWNDVLISDGQGCYNLVIEYNISGVIGTLNWGSYKLLPYSIQNALKTARVRAIFNGYHEIEGINFAGSNVESTHRFYGFIGNRQPNTEIDNIIYNNREMKRVIRENLNAYEIVTDPSDECTILPLVDLYLLSENELFISDYNAHNFSYRYNDIPVILEESAEIEYKDFSRKAVLKAKVSDKFKNKRTYYS